MQFAFVILMLAGNALSSNYSVKCYTCANICGPHSKSWNVTQCMGSCRMELMKLPGNKPAIVVVDSNSAPGAAIWRIRPNLTSCLILAQRENTTSATKPEAHNLLHCRHSGASHGHSLTRVQNVMKFGRVVSRFASVQTDRQRDTPRPRAATTSWTC